MLDREFLEQLEVDKIHCPREATHARKGTHPDTDGVWNCARRGTPNHGDHGISYIPTVAYTVCCRSPLALVGTGFSVH